jgi:hypothetical protein
MKLEAARSSETLVSNHRTTRLSNPENRRRFLGFLYWPLKYVWLLGIGYISEAVQQGLRNYLLWALGDESVSTWANKKQLSLTKII